MVDEAKRDEMILADRVRSLHGDDGLTYGEIATRLDQEGLIPEWATAGMRWNSTLLSKFMLLHGYRVRDHSERLEKLQEPPPASFPPGNGDGPALDMELPEVGEEPPVELYEFSELRKLLDLDISNGRKRAIIKFAVAGWE